MFIYRCPGGETLGMSTVLSNVAARPPLPKCRAAELRGRAACISHFECIVYFSSMCVIPLPHAGNSSTMSPSHASRIAAVGPPSGGTTLREAPACLRVGQLLSISEIFVCSLAFLFPAHTERSDQSCLFSNLDISHITFGRNAAGEQTPGPRMLIY